MRNHFLGEALLGERGAGHAARRHLGQRDADALRDEGHRARCPGVRFEDVDVAVLHGQLHVHQPDHAELQRQRAHLAADFVLRLFRQRERRQRAGRVAGVDAGLFDVLHDGADHHLLAVRHGVDVHFHGLVEKAVEEHRRGIGDVHRAGEVALEVARAVDDLHGASAEHVGRAHDDGIADLGGRVDAALQVEGGAVGGLAQADLVDHALEALPILGAVDGVRAGADDVDAGGMQPIHQLERRLAAELHDQAVRLLHVDDGQHVLEGHRLEVQPVRGVVVGGDGLRIAVHHDGLEAVFAHRQCRVDAAVVELDALPDAVRAAAEHHDLAPLGRGGLALFLVGGVEVGGRRRKLRGAGVHALEHRLHAVREAPAAHVLLGALQ